MSILEEILSKTYFRNESDKELYISYYNANQTYNSVGCRPRTVSSYLHKKIANRWSKLPDDVKKSGFQGILGYMYLNPPVQNTSPSFFNHLYNTNYPEDVPYYKVLALEQLNFVRDHFKDEQSFIEMADKLMALPDDAKTVFSALNDHNIYNLRYVPNKIALVEEFCQDYNVNNHETVLFVNNNDLSFHDIINFSDKESNFSKDNYVKSIDKLMSVLSNDIDGGNKFRKIYPLISHAKPYDMYSFDFDDDYEYDSDEEEDTRQPLQTEETNHSFYRYVADVIDNDVTEFHESDSELAELYYGNLRALNHASIGLSKIFGAQASVVLDEYLKVNDAYQIDEFSSRKSVKEEIDRLESNIRIDRFEELAEDVEQLMGKGAKLSSSKLKDLSYKSARDSAENHFEYLSELILEDYRKKPFITNDQIQKDVLEFCSYMPTNLTSEKSRSFAKFVLSKFFYRQKDGAKKTRNIGELKIIAEKWNQLSPDQENLKYNEVLALCRGNQYINGRKDAFEDAFKLSMGIDNDQYFDMAQSAYLRGINTPRTIHYEKPVVKNDISVELMPIDDPEVMLISNRHNICCQHIAGAGKFPAISSAEDPFSRAMLIKEKDKPIGIAWLWTREEERDGQQFTSMCIDNVELRGFADSQEDITAAIKDLSVAIAEENGFKRVTIGTHSKIYNPKAYFPLTEPLELPSNYGKAFREENVDGKLDYNDSQEQCEIYHNPNARPFNPHNEVETYIADRDSYVLSRAELNEMNQVAAECYPAGWQNVSMAAKNPQFKLLYDINKNLMGYISYSDDERNIYDLAVRPKYRGYSKYLINSIKAHGAELGGTWTADARDSTSFRLLKLFAARGDLEVTELPSYNNMKGETLHRVQLNMTPKGQEVSTGGKDNQQKISKLKSRLFKGQTQMQTQNNFQSESKEFSPVLQKEREYV